MARSTKWGGAALTAAVVVAGLSVVSADLASAADHSTGPNLATDLSHPSSVTAKSVRSTSTLTPRSQQVSAAATGSSYVSATPQRTFDTRTNAMGQLGADRALFFTYKSGEIDPRINAITYNLTVTNPTADTFITAWDGQSNRPTATNINVRRGETRSHQVTIPLGTSADGSRTLAIYNHSGSVDLITDLEGAYGVGAAQTGETLTGYQPLSQPARALDSRNENRTLGAGQKLTVDLSQYVPANATAATIDLTGLATNSNTFLTAYPSGAALPTASSVNVTAGETTPNLINVQLAANKKIDIYNHSGSTDVIVDVFGNYTPTSANLYYPIPGTRVLDTRTTSTPLAAGVARTVTTGAPVGSIAVDANITATNVTQNTYFSAYTDETRPATSVLNPTVGRDVSNEALTGVTAADQSFTLVNNTGTSDGVVDLFGYFAPAPAN